MHGDLIIVVLLVVFGCAAFLFGVIHLGYQLLVGLGRVLVRLFKPRSPIKRPRVEPATRTRRVCPNPYCRKMEQRNARFCSQCGAQMR